MGIESPNFSKKDESVSPELGHGKLGGELKGKPIQGPDGQWRDKFGEKISADEAYASVFWEKQPKGKREVMMGSIRRAAEKGEISELIPPEGIVDSYYKEKLSAYRLLAREMGYEIGKFIFKKQAGTAIAPIKKIEQKQG